MKKIFALILYLVTFSNINSQDQTWPQFRGINGSGVAPDSDKPPIKFTEDYLNWRIELPAGISSPVIWKEKLFITGYDESNKELHTLCINNLTGKVIWDNPIKPDSIEKTSQIGNPAQSTVVTDGERVIVHFGSCGILCYDMMGKIIWRYKLPCNRNSYGSATSLVISGGKAIYLNDFGKPYLMALNLQDGSRVWKTQLNPSPFPSPGGHSVPCISNDRIIIHRIGEISCFSVKDGSGIWTYNLLTSGISSPIVAGKRVITACWYNFSEANQIVQLPDFKELIQKYDKNLNGTVDRSELPDDFIMFLRPEIPDLPGTTGSVRSVFSIFDTNKDKEINLPEWNGALDLLKNTFYKPAGLIALDIMGQGLISDDKVLWRSINNIPEVPTPVFYRDKIYMIKDGGILTCLNAATGEVLYSTRIGNPGPYMASPIAANGHIYILGYNGRMKVIKAGDKYEVASDYDFKDRIAATPAIIGNTIFIRTGKNLLSFSNK